MSKMARSNLKKTCKYSFNILLIGDPGVGKSSVIRRFAGKFSVFVERGSRGVELRKVLIGEDLVRIVAHDSDGDKTTRELTKAYYTFSLGVLLLYSIDDRTSFDNLPSWLEHFREHGYPDSALTLVGNKADANSKRVVTKDEAALFARENGLNFLEVSAKDGLGVDAAFRVTAVSIYAKLQEGAIDPTGVRNGLILL